MSLIKNQRNEMNLKYVRFTKLKMSLGKVYSTSSLLIRQPNPKKCCIYYPFFEKSQRIYPITKRLCRKDILYYELKNDHELEQVCIQ